MPSLETVRASRIRPFLKRLSQVSARYSSTNAAHTLHKHLDIIKKNAKNKESHDAIEELKEKINEIMETENDLMAFEKEELDTEKQLKRKINDLEEELHKITQERDFARSQNREKILELSDSVHSIKGKLNDLITIHRRNN